MAKQTTLFQSWGAQSKKQSSSKNSNNPKSNRSNAVIDLSVSPDLTVATNDEEEDKMLALALEQSMKDQQMSNQGSSKSYKPLKFQQSSTNNLQNNTWSMKKATRQGPSTSSSTSNQSSGLFKSVGTNRPIARQTSTNTSNQPTASTSEIRSNYNDRQNEVATFEIPDEWSDDEQDVIPEATNIEDIPGFDNDAGKMWIYPTNYPVREYQFNIVQSALYKNTLVVLPTGLGKTFIAAVLMYNFYRWYPRGKVVFMAPTKPLVAQQIEACYNIMGIPQSDTAEMTGTFQFVRYTAVTKVRMWSKPLFISRAHHITI